MPHFTVVPVQDNSTSNYDSLEGINWVDYRDTGQGDTVSSDGKFSFHVSLCEKHPSRHKTFGLITSGAKIESLFSSKVRFNPSIRDRHQKQLFSYHDNSQVTNFIEPISYIPVVEKF